ncbi:DUF1801 domain-containing protein [Planotetraspora phitsanulokensis]|uniref:YdhG-like domain-containing protein n=1 Tax=Planotetraspora phitsanulokensis TaxID=575192 RepID=A0A8J3XN49_9ACTN|nr:DUF1801 domain-containing protein [Planotetraspora phitsanulokensis]GII42423.1 hypothetical protein Pph01_74260 [Planotetraspora phitsanulokensis]
MPNEAVDEFVRTKVLPEHQSIVGTLRELMKENAPGAEEVISRGSPAWQGKKLLAIISPSKTHITFAFARGAEFKDEFGLLEGVGKTTRHVKIKKADALNEDALRDYIGQAVRLDQE